MKRLRAGLGVCVGPAEGAPAGGDRFDNRQNSITILRSAVDDADRPRVAAAIASCPVMALSLEDR